MGIDYTFLEDGTQLLANTITTRFNSIATGINELDVDDVAPAAYNLNHLPSAIVASGQVTLAGATTYTATAGPAAGSYYPGFGVDAGWTVLTQGGTDLAISFGGTVYLTDDTQATGARGVLVLADINFRKLEDGGANASSKYTMYFVLQYKSGGSWYTVDRSERFVCATYEYGVALSPFIPVTIRALLTSENIAHTTITDVRVVCALAWTSGDAPAGTLTATIGECSLSAIAFRSALY